MTLVNLTRNTAFAAVVGVVAGLAPAITSAAETPADEIRVATISRAAPAPALDLEKQVDTMNANLLADLHADLELRLRNQLSRAADDVLAAVAAADTQE